MTELKSGRDIYVARGPPRGLSRRAYDGARATTPRLSVAEPRRWVVSGTGIAEAEMKYACPRGARDGGSNGRRA